MRFWFESSAQKPVWLHLYSYNIFARLKTCLESWSQADWTPPSPFVPISINSCLNSKPPCHNNDKRVVQGENVAKEKRWAQEYKRLYQCLEHRWCGLHVTRFCNVRGSFQSFAGKIQVEQRKSPRERKIDGTVFIQEFLPEEGRHVEKQRLKPGFSFEDSRKREIQLFIFFLWKLDS